MNAGRPGFNAAPLSDPKHVHPKLGTPAGGHTFIHPCLAGCSCTSTIAWDLPCLWPVETVRKPLAAVDTAAKVDADATLRNHIEELSVM